MFALLVGVGVFGTASPSLSATTPTLTAGDGVGVNFYVQRASSAFIAGSGFTPNATYTLTTPYGKFGATSQALTVTADATGAFNFVDFRLTTDVPFSVKKFTISAVDQSDAVVATIEADVFPPQFGVGYCPGQSETVTGRGFPDGTYSIATSDSTGVALSASTVTPTNGVITVGVTPANVPPLSVHMTLTSQADPTITWSTTWQRASSYPTASTSDQTQWSMRARGSCFIPGEKVDVLAHDATTTVPPIVTADSGGSISFKIDFKPTAAPHGSAYVSATGEESSQWANFGGSVSVPGTQLHPGQVMESPNATLVSPNPGYQFMLNGANCDPLVEMIAPTGGGSEVWDAGVPWQNTNCHLEISDSGNLAVYSSSGAVLWATHTRGSNTDNYAEMRQDGNLVIYSATGALVWLSGPLAYDPSTHTYISSEGPQVPPATARLASGATLHRGHYIRNGNTKLELLKHGNIVVLRGTKQVWTSRTAGRGAVALTMERNGDLVLKNAAGRTVWSSRTAYRGRRDQVIIGANGDVAIWSSTHHMIWHTNSGI